MKIVCSCLFLCSSMFFYAQERIDEHAVGKLKNGVIVHEEFSGKEPTKPEATEFYEPKVPKVTPGVNGEPPSDAIVLFDGSSLENWVSSKDTVQTAPWHLYGGVMTV